MFIKINSESTVAGEWQGKNVLNLKTNTSKLLTNYVLLKYAAYIAFYTVLYMTRLFSTAIN